MVSTARNSQAFRNYVKEISEKIRDKFIKNNRKIHSGQLLLDGIKRLHFQVFDDKGANYWKNGLIITIDQLSYIEVVLTNIVHKNNEPIEFITDFILYDTYGLDMEDMKKFGALNILDPSSKNVSDARKFKQSAISEDFWLGF